jgi:hypothetical protein
MVGGIKINKKRAETEFHKNEEYWSKHSCVNLDTIYGVTIQRIATFLQFVETRDTALFSAFRVSILSELSLVDLRCVCHRTAQRDRKTDPPILALLCGLAIPSGI